MVELAVRTYRISPRADYLGNEQQLTALVWRLAKGLSPTPSELDHVPRYYLRRLQFGVGIILRVSPIVQSQESFISKNKSSQAAGKRDLGSNQSLTSDQPSLSGDLQDEEQRS